MRTRITATNAADALSITVGGQITASATTRTLAGPIIRYGVHGRTSRGSLKVAPGALRFPEDLSRVKLTREHYRDESRGYLVAVEDTPDGIRAALKVADGPEGDAALREAADKTRDGFSFDVVDAVVDGDTITSALVIAIGQVGIPAYDDLRIDSIAAAATNNTGENMTPAQRARLAELNAMQTRTPEQETELAQLVALDTAEPAAPAAPAEPPAAPAAGVPVAASIPAVPGGVPRQTSRTSVTERDPLGHFVRTVVQALESGGGAQAITAALTDVTSTQHTDNIEAPAWSGELWSGLQYEPQFTDLFNTGDLTNWEGKGWRWVTKPAMQDYAGDKAAIGSGALVTEPSTYEAARMAVGHDIDRKFYDFPNEGFLRSYVEACREDWAVKLDAKVRAYIAANAVAGTRTAQVTTTNASAAITAPAGTFSTDDIGATITGAGIPAATTIIAVASGTAATMSANATASATVTATIGLVSAKLLKAAALAVKSVKKATRAKATFVAVNDDDLFDLFEVTETTLPSFLELFNIDPKNFRSSPDIARGTVYAGVKQAATLRTLPGSPIRVSAQHIANGGIDEAFFGYWAVEEHHTSGIATVKYTG